MWRLAWQYYIRTMWLGWAELEIGHPTHCSYLHGISMLSRRSKSFSASNHTTMLSHVRRCCWPTWPVGEAPALYPLPPHTALVFSDRRAAPAYPLLQICYAKHYAITHSTVRTPLLCYLTRLIVGVILAGGGNVNIQATYTPGKGM